MIRLSAALIRSVVAWMLMTVANPSSAATPDPETGVKDVVKLDNPAVTESSGLACSWRSPGHFWTHNDSGGRARLYAFDRTGKATGRVDLSGIKAIDWEDMASYKDAGVPRLLVADCGDNDRRRGSISFYLLDEPDPNQATSIGPERMEVFTVKYPDGSHDCEAVAVDPARRQIVLVAKRFLPSVGVYTVPLPPRVEGKLSVRHEAIAKRIATLPIPMVTAMDIDQSNGDAWVAGYFQVFHYQCPDRKTGLASQFQSQPQMINLPRWRQIEAFAIDDAQDRWLTSEGSPMPLGRLEVISNP